MGLFELFKVAFKKKKKLPAAVNHIVGEGAETKPSVIVSKKTRRTSVASQS